ncbi:uncharacterized protein A1O5_00653 [Cladophialophora psammophila CBS 110553]|uniref:NTF2-like domain-containing protein n=1 Tax=Cladophialophora psammophila CBS 110553 TaxID=1182543 RepID=W9XFM9_9EURO|nr:uncharacterized protein A1O5_00653 [Cladophialophora psammophila CBS 110553]EXJ76145.1 hypothetical protein A1O5_00653 [Cladophialophora psammophila CBS 110553]
MKFFSTILTVSAFAGVTFASPQRGGFARPSPPPHTIESKTDDHSTTSSPTPGYSSSSPAYSAGHGSSTSSAPVAASTTAYPTTTTTTFKVVTTTTSVAPLGTVTCLSTAAATNVVNGFASLLTAYSNATAESLLASDFTDTSDSINFLAGNPLGSTTFPSKLAFELGQGSQPAIGFQVLNIDAITCKVIAFRWEAILGSSSPVKGINILYTENPTQTDDGWQIQSVFSEFNSGTWTIEIGGTCVPPSQAGASR